MQGYMYTYSETFENQQLNLMFCQDIIWDFRHLCQLILVSIIHYNNFAYYISDII